jgi:hypothetical protein
MSTLFLSSSGKLLVASGRPLVINTVKAAANPIYRYNCGSASNFTDQHGAVWTSLLAASSQNFDYTSAGVTPSPPDGNLYLTVIRNTTNTFTTFSVPLPDGQYRVTGRWREFIYSAANTRTQSLRISGGGATLFAVVDSWVSGNGPVILTSPQLITVTGGAGLSLDLVYVSNQPILAALEFEKIA